MSVTSIRQPDDQLIEQRRDLAAAFRWTARLNMHEGIANHFSLAVSDDGAEFLVNAYGDHFSQIRASDLLHLNSHNPADGERDDVDPTAWFIHGALHRRYAHARCILHVHSKYATVLASLTDSTIPPIDQTSMRYFNRVAVDDGYDGIGLEEEGERLADTLGNHSTLIMGNHGVLVVGDTVAKAFDNLYYFERAAETVIMAYQTGKPLRVASDAVAEKTARQWEEYPEGAERHFAALRGILDREEPDYKD